MARHSHEKAAWRTREACRRYQAGFPRPRHKYMSIIWGRRPSRQEVLERIGRDLDTSVHGGLSHFTRRYRRGWRQAGRRIGRLSALGDERAEELDPQPCRLGVMWDIW
jgi:hypothetical protein